MASGRLDRQKDRGLGRWSHYPGFKPEDGALPRNHPPKTSGLNMVVRTADSHSGGLAGTHVRATDMQVACEAPTRRCWQALGDMWQGS